MSGRTDGHTRNRQPITDEMIPEQPGEVEPGYDSGQLAVPRRPPGRPPTGAPAMRAGSVRLEPALRVQAAQRAAAEGVTVSEVIRRALREYLQRA